jgi:hypothetical protein
MALPLPPVRGMPQAVPKLGFQLTKRDKEPNVGLTQGGSARTRAARVAANDGTNAEQRDLFKPGKGGWGF